MSEQPSTQDNQQSTQDAQTAQQVTQQQVPAPSTQQPSSTSTQPSTQEHRDNGPLDKLLQAIEALPEKVAASVREQSPQHPRQQPRQQQNNSNSGQQNTGQQSGGASTANQGTQPAVPGSTRKTTRFADWWFSEPRKRDAK